MRATLRRRLAVLESKLKPIKALDDLDAEIRAMTAPERNVLRDFLLYAKNGGQSEQQKFNDFKRAAEAAILTARQRLGVVNLS
jgi:hypothetical protein